MHKILIIMIYYMRSLAVHSAVLSYVLISTVSCSPLCHALTCTHTYSPLRSTLPCSHMYSYIQSLAVHSAMLSCVLKLYRRQSTYITHRLHDLYNRLYLFVREKYMTMGYMTDGSMTDSTLTIWLFGRGKCLWIYHKTLVFSVGNDLFVFYRSHQD